MLLIDKPIGITSFDVVSRVRRHTNIKKVGHAGTLDPLASGLMIVLIGRDETKQANKFLKLDKSYITTIRLGEARDTGDLEGRIVAHATINQDISRETVENTLKTMQTTLKIAVPAYSAIKINGQRLYKLARKGQTGIDPPIRDMTVYKADLLHMQPIETDYGRSIDITVEFDVASGVYIRSLAVEFGRRIGLDLCNTPLPATVTMLRRTKIGKYDIKDAVKLKDL